MTKTDPADKIPNDKNPGNKKPQIIPNSDRNPTIFFFNFLNYQYRYKVKITFNSKYTNRFAKFVLPMASRPRSVICSMQSARIWLVLPLLPWRLKWHDTSMSVVTFPSSVGKRWTSAAFCPINILGNLYESLVTFVIRVACHLFDARECSYLNSIYFRMKLYRHENGSTCTVSEGKFTGTMGQVPL